MTPNKEDYLKCIYEIGIDLHKITNKEIAARMQVSPPAVTEMIKRMKSENLILKDKECGYLLTDLGLKLVSELYRKHRLIEVFLVHHLDYTSYILLFLYVLISYRHKRLTTKILFNLKLMKLHI